MGRLVLIRHGRPAGHDGRCVGHFDTELAPSALDDVLHLAASVLASPPGLVVASDLKRAADTARVIANAWGAELRFDPRVRELYFGDWEGRTWDEIGAADRATLDAWAADWTRVAPPNGESGMALEARAREALDDLLPVAEAMPSGMSVVSHAGWIRVATTLLLGTPLASAFDRSIDYARAAVFTVSESRATLEAWNVLACAPGAINADAAALPPARSSARP
jgi:broad specificity phosphatase PhoE